MPGPDDPLPLLNVFEVADDEGGTRHLLAFIEAVRAGSSGIDPRSIVGEITPNDEGGYDATSLKLNPEFIGAFTDYMNEVHAVEPGIVEQARSLPSGWVYIMDPRHVEEPGTDPPPTDLVGAFAVDDDGQVAPQSFQYNENHVLIDRERGMSGLFSDRRFYDWLHPSEG
jgi:hypothetical protein